MLTVAFRGCLLWLLKQRAKIAELQAFFVKYSQLIRHPVYEMNNDVQFIWYRPFLDISVEKIILCYLIGSSNKETTEITIHFRSTWKVYCINAYEWKSSWNCDRIMKHRDKLNSIMFDCMTPLSILRNSHSMSTFYLATKYSLMNLFEY